jgi:hypothetical protein
MEPVKTGDRRERLRYGGTGNNNEENVDVIDMIQ